MRCSLDLCAKLDVLHVQVCACHNISRVTNALRMHDLITFLDQRRAMSQPTVDERCDDSDDHEITY